MSETSNRAAIPWVGLAAVGVGIAIGVVAGATAKGSGSIYTLLVLPGCVLALAAGAGLIGLVAGLTGSPAAAWKLAGFGLAAIVAMGAAFAVAPSYRSPPPPGQREGDLTLHIAEPVPKDWAIRGVCSPVTTQGYGSVSADVTRDGIHMWLGLIVRNSAPPVAAWINIAMSAGRAGSAFYYASIDEASLETTTMTADGMSGVVRFDAPAQPSSAQRGQQPDRLAGTFEWACPGS